jgi:hypothetical protein
VARVVTVHSLRFAHDGAEMREQPL